MALHMISRAASLASAVLVGASLSLAPLEAHAGPGPSAGDRPIEGPARPPANPPEGEQPTGEPTPPGITPPPPTYEPTEPTDPGIEFVIPPPESETEDPEPTEQESPLAATWPDPGEAPNDGASMLVLGGTTIGLTALTLGVGLKLGLDYQTPLEQLLPATIIPSVITIAMAGGGLYLGIKRARDHHRWELAYRVVGEPQGGGLKVGASFTLLAALGLIPSGAWMLQQGDVPNGATFIALGSAAAVATPIMFAIGGRRSRNYARTGGWHRRPLPLIPGSNESRLHVTPLVAPTLGGFSLGASGRF